MGGDWGQGGLGFAPRRRDARDPPHPSLGELLEGVGAIEGTISHEIGRAVGRLQLLHVGTNHVAKVVGITAVATERLQQQGNAGLVLDNSCQQDLVQIGALRPTIAAGHGHDRRVRGRVAVIAAIDVDALRWCAPMRRPAQQSN